MEELKKVRERISCMTGVDIKSLFNNRIVEGKNFFIGGGTLIFENYFIALDSIAVVTLNRVQDISMNTPIIGLVLCIFLLLIPVSIIRIICALLIVYFGLLIYLIWRKNKNKIYTLQIDLCNGKQYLYSHNDEQFICQIADVIRMCIDDRGGTYTIVSNENRIENYIDQSVKGNNNQYIGKAKNIATGNGMVNDFGKKNEINDNVMSNVHGNMENVRLDNVLNENEWTMLEQFLSDRQLKVISADNKESCKNVLNDVRKKDAKGLKRRLQQIGKRAIVDIFFKGASETMQEKVKSLLQKILKV